MYNKLNYDVKHYLYQIKKGLSCSSYFKKKIVNDLKNNIGEYILENPSSTIKDIIDHFGTPEEISSNDLSLLEDDRIKSKLVFRKRIIRIVIAIGIILVFLCLILVLYELLCNQHYSNRYFSTLVENIN